MKGHVAMHDAQRLIDLGGGTTRRILAYNDELMSVEVAFETGSVGAVHTHPHTQLSYVLSGRGIPLWCLPGCPMERYVLKKAYCWMCSIPNETIS